MASSPRLTFHLVKAGYHISQKLSQQAAGDIPINDLKKKPLRWFVCKVILTMFHQGPLSLDFGRYLRAAEVKLTHVKSMSYRSKTTLITLVFLLNS